MLQLLFVLLLAGIITVIINGLQVKYALQIRLFDVPNERSSHIIPTPRGGGLGIVIGFSIAIAGYWLQVSPSIFLWSILLLSWIVAAIGFYDDLMSCSARLRLFFHSLTS